nr:putative oxidoreductase [Quercus suber]
MLAAKRLQSLNRHILREPYQRRSIHSKSTAMAKFDINSKLRMNSGCEIPILGYDVAEAVTSHAIQSGYRHVDSAVAYSNEQPSATGMMQGASKLSIPREQLFYTSKVPPKSVNYEGAKACVNQTLKLTGLSYIDLYLLHAPYGGREARLGAWKALVEAVNEGKVKSIGVSNYGVHHLDELEQWQKTQSGSEAGVLSVNQVELHPWLARPDIAKWCQERSVVLEAYCPLVRNQRADDPLVTPLMKKHGKTAAQILLRWGVQKGFVILPKSVTPSRIEENAQIYDFELDEEDMRSLETGKYEPCAWDPIGRFAGVLKGWKDGF